MQKQGFTIHDSRNYKHLGSIREFQDLFALRVMRRGLVRLINIMTSYNQRRERYTNSVLLHRENVFCSNFSSIIVGCLAFLSPIATPKYHYMSDDIS